LASFDDREQKENFFFFQVAEYSSQFPAARKSPQELAILPLATGKPSNVLLKMRKPPCSLLSVLNIKLRFQKERLVERDQGNFVPKESVCLNMGCQKPIREM
jgi:hypothetical protein